MIAYTSTFKAGERRGVVLPVPPPADDRPSMDWTVAQLGEWATAHGVDDYPISGLKADKVAALQAAYDSEKGA